MPAIISEIRYRNGPGFNPNEDFVEIRVPTGTDVSDLSVGIYNQNGSLRSSTDVSDGTMTTVGSFDYYVVNARINRFGAMSLSDDESLISFVSLDAEVTATEGPADGQTSTQVGTNGNDSTSSLSSFDGTNFFVDPNPNPRAPCFTKGTSILTDNGEVPVERLTPGDRVVATDGTLHTLRLNLSRSLRHSELIRTPKLRPVCIVAGALGKGLPHRDLRVSRQHRMLTDSPIAQRMFGTRKVLVSAIRLTTLPGIYLDVTATEVIYYHLVFDQHVTLFAEGAPTESLFFGPLVMAAVSEEARHELVLLFPDIAKRSVMVAASYIPDGSRQKKLVERHAFNNKPLLSQPTAIHV
ncbi:Hint domain-containing protein [Ruegeria arenilitoris]|uniref:Hint domain-containing protein n=1 Tax=Ruegeria arenilitoris TaxID=1173585 RepID=UPI00147C2CCD|nr:Hint domain-containing protein [Ruegeria arenilitoris]